MYFIPLLKREESIAKEMEIKKLYVIATILIFLEFAFFVGYLFGEFNTLINYSNYINEACVEWRVHE